MYFKLILSLLINHILSKCMGSINHTIKKHTSYLTMLQKQYIKPCEQFCDNASCKLGSSGLFGALAIKMIIPMIIQMIMAVNRLPRVSS